MLLALKRWWRNATSTGVTWAPRCRPGDRFTVSLKDSRTTADLAPMWTTAALSPNATTASLAGSITSAGLAPSEV